MKRVIDGVAKGSQDQAQAVAQTSTAMAKLADAVSAIGLGAQTQAQGMDRAAIVQVSLGRSLDSVSESTRTVSNSAQHSAQSAIEGVRLSADSVAGMQRVEAATAQLAGRVKDLGKRTGQISAIVETIDDIAGQTNLLALNAAIEAARAGEHGKGFAVVADEVRKLAERSALATKEIADMIRLVQTGASEVVEAMQATGNDVKTAGTATEEAGAAFQTIANGNKGLLQQIEAIEAAIKDMQASNFALEKSVAEAKANAAANQKVAIEMSALNGVVVASLDNVSAVVEENTAATEQMAAGAGEVAQSVESIASVSEENAAAVEEVSASAEEMSAQVEEVTASAQSLATMAEALQDIVSQFKLNQTSASTTPDKSLSKQRPPALPVLTYGQNAISKPFNRNSHYLKILPLN
jgi:methyl-accepting chemotaxis protein